MHLALTQASGSEGEGEGAAVVLSQALAAQTLHPMRDRAVVRLKEALGRTRGDGFLVRCKRTPLLQ